ncbi:hypothetical protein A4X13_0g5302 [Tilletia indica]|uniref:Uncharacterized protein n=1 Tax=Tilletia indica TaxID=43049 RepID=A0A8T8SU31_9BASI|nr:hypothetical protein A4X13_0g5302 [Tilletia indica]
MSSSGNNLHRPRLMRAPHTSPPLPATTSLLLSRGSTSWDIEDDTDENRLSPSSFDNDKPSELNLDGNKHKSPERRNHIARLPQEIILRILTFVHSDLVYPRNATHPLYFQPLEQRQQAAHLALLRLTAVCGQFASAILSRQAGSIWRHVDGSAVFPVPRIASGESDEHSHHQQQSVRTTRHLSPALLVALARTAGPAVSSLNLRGVHFSSGIEANAGIGSVFSAAQLFEHILEAQGVSAASSALDQHASKQFAPPNFSFPRSELGFAPSGSSKQVWEEGQLTASPLSEEAPLPPLPHNATSPRSPRVTQLTHLDLRSLRIDPIQLAPARRALATLLSASPNLVSLQLANADSRLVDDDLLDTSIPNPHKLRELDLSRCAGVSAQGVVRLLRKIETYQNERVQSGDEAQARDVGLKTLRIVGLRSMPPAPLDENAGQDGRRAVVGRRGRGRLARAADESETDEDEEVMGRLSDESPPSGNGSSGMGFVHPLEEMLALLRQTSAHSLEVLDANYVLELSDAHMLAFTHVRPELPSNKRGSASSSGPKRQLTIKHEQIKLSRALASVTYFPLRRSALARALEEHSDTSNVVLRTIFPHLRSLALSSNPRLTSAVCGFLVGALPACETLEMAGWSSRAFLDHERDPDGRRIRREGRNGRDGGGGGAPPLPGDGPLVDLLESMSRVRRLDLEGAAELSDAVLRALTPSPSIRTRNGEQEKEDIQPGQHLTHLIVSHAYRLSPRATLDLMRGATRLVHLELDDTRAGCDHVAKEWAMLMKARKSGLKAAAAALALPFATGGTASNSGEAGGQVERAAPTPYLSLVDCRGFSKEEYERLSRRGYVRAREAIGVRPRLAHVGDVKLGEVEASSFGGGLLEGGSAGNYEWGREWFGYEGRAEVMPVSNNANAETSTAAQAQQAAPSPEEQPSPQGGSSPSRASRLALALPLSLGMALVRRASGHPPADDDSDDVNGEGTAGGGQLSLPGLPFRIRAHLGGGGSNASGSGDRSNGGPDGDETNPALGVLKSFWGWQAVDTRAKARKKRLAKEEKVRKAAAAAASAAANASTKRGAGTSRSLSFGGLDAAARNAMGSESGATGGSSTGLRNSTAAALALLLRRTGASSAGAAMSAAFGPMTPPLSRSPSPPAGGSGGIPIPGAVATTPSPSGGSRRTSSRRSDSGFGWGSGSPSTPGAQSSMSAFSLMALAGHRGGATGGPTTSRGGSSAFSFSFSPSTSPTWERNGERMRSMEGGHGSPVSLRQALAFAEAAAEAGLSPTEAEMLAIAATSAHGSPIRVRAQSGSGSGARLKSSRMNSRGSSSAAQLLLSSPASLMSELSSVRSRPSSVRSFKDKVREKGDRAKGRISRLLSPGSSSGGGRGGGEGVRGSVIPSRISSSQPVSGATTPRRMTAPSVTSSSAAFPSLAADTSASERGVPQYYAPVGRERVGGAMGMEGLGTWLTRHAFESVPSASSYLDRDRVYAGARRLGWPRSQVPTLPTFVNMYEDNKPHASSTFLGLDLVSALPQYRLLLPSQVYEHLVKL